MSDIIDLVLSSVSTGAFYFLSNYHTYNIGTSMACSPPLHDFFHDILPDLSRYVNWRDFLLPLFFIPLIFVVNRGTFVLQLIEGFMYIVTLKAITIFFTFLPPSNPGCAQKKQVNHCFHQMFSGHNSLVVLLCILYLFHVREKSIKMIFILLTIIYSFFILMTRAHYTVDVIVSYIIVLLMFRY